MSRFEVCTPSLLTAAAGCDAVADALAHVAVALRVQGHPDTGSGSSTAQAGHVVDQLIAAVTGLGTAALGDGDGLRAAAATYAHSDASAVRPR